MDCLQVLSGSITSALPRQTIIWLAKPSLTPWVVSTRVSRPTSEFESLAENFTSDRYPNVFHTRPARLSGSLRVLFVTVGDL